MAIIGIAGTKGAGKDSTARLITGMVMQNLHMINKFEMNDNGDLIVTCEYPNGRGVSYKTDILDLTRRDEAFMTYLYEALWPHVKIYHLADSLKYLLANMFRLDINKLFGTQADKESLCQIKWKQFLDVLPKDKVTKELKAKAEDEMKYREVMQYFADIMRHIDDSCFINYLMDEIAREQVPITIIADLRREEEVDAVNAAGGRIIYLTRGKYDDDKHPVENALTKIDITKFDIVIDNQNMSMKEKNTKLINELKDRGFLQ